MAQANSWFDFEQFAHMAGFHEGLKTLEDKGQAKWTNTASDLQTGGVHGLRYKVNKDEENNLQIILQHWVHWPNGVAPKEEKKKKRDPEFLVFKTETRKTEDGRIEIKPKAARWMGRWYEKPADLMKLMHLMQTTSEEVRNNIAKNTDPVTTPYDASTFPNLQMRVRQTKRRDEIPNLYDLAHRTGIHMTHNLPGMYFNGEFNFIKEEKKSEVPSYPKAIVHAMLGLEYDALSHDYKTFSNTVTIPNKENSGYEGVTYHYEPIEVGADVFENGFRVSCNIWEAQPNGVKKDTTFYQVEFVPDPDDSSQMKLKNMELLGYKPEMKDQKGVARAVRAMKYINLAIKRNEPPMFSDILHDHDLKGFLRMPEKPDATEKNPRTMMQVFGANMDAAFSQKEMGIGSNGLVIIRDFMDGDKWVRLGIGADWGITFGDPKNDYYHSISHNYGRFLQHPTAPHIEPYADTFLSVETHEHEDHLRGVARLAKFGFNLPPMVMNKHTYNVLDRMMKEEKVKPEKILNVLSNCHVIDVHNDVDPENPEDRKRYEYGDTVVEQWTEVIWSEEENKNKYFPIMEAYKKQYPEAKTQIRVGPAGHSAHALMFDVAGILYTGDYKMDQTVPEKLRTDKDWLKACKDCAVHVQECTNATKPVPFNATVQEVKENRKEIFRKEAGSRVLYDTIGSNAIDIEMVCRAAGEVRKELLEKSGEDVSASSGPYKHIIFAGAAIRNKYRDLNETDGFKKAMNAEFGIKTLHIDTKTAKELLETEEPGSYMIVMSGTQDEPMSVTHRVSRDLHPSIRLEKGDIIVRGQAPIPVGNNFRRREDQNNRYRQDFGCKVYDAAELAKEGVHIYASSHASQNDVKEVHELTGDMLRILFHGGPSQINKMHERFEGWGARSIIPDKQHVYEIDHKNKGVKIIGETPEERVGYREIRADQDEFFNKHRQQATVTRVKDRWSGDVAKSMYEFERLADQILEEKHTHKPTDRGVNLVDDFAKATGTEDFPPIGVLHPEMRRPYYSMHKNIKMMIGMDAETTGANPAVDVHTDLSFVAADMDGKIKKEMVLKHALPRYRMASVGAIGVTNNDKPIELHKGDNTRKFAWKAYKAYRELVPKLTKDPHARGLYLGYRNGVFDDPITMRVLGMGLATNDMKPMSTYGNLQLDVYNFYAAMIALHPDKVGAKKDKNGFYERTLETACKKNGVEYDKAKAHGSLYDSQRVLKLLLKFKEISPDVFDQMLMNADFSPSRHSPMIDHILGQDLHLNDQAPLFGYVNPKDRTCTPGIGALVTIDTEVSKATDAIILNLAKTDVHQLKQLSDQKLLEAMNDPDGPFEVIKLNNSPCLFPPQFVYNNQKARRKAIGRLPKSTLLKRADAIKKMRDNDNGVGNNFIQRVQRLYPDSKLCRARAARNDWKPGQPRLTKPFRLPNERIFSLFNLMNHVNRIKNRHYRKAAELLRDIQPTDEEFTKAFNQESFWKDALQRAKAISDESGGHDRNIEDMRFLIEWMVEDINPKWLEKEDREKINAMKSTLLNGPESSQVVSIERFLHDLNEMEGDKEQFKRVMGSGEEGKRKWKRIKKACEDYLETMSRSRKYNLTETKRDTLRNLRKNQNISLR